MRLGAIGALALLGVWQGCSPSTRDFSDDKANGGTTPSAGSSAKAGMSSSSSGTDSGNEAGSGATTKGGSSTSTGGAATEGGEPTTLPGGGEGGGADNACPQNAQCDDSDPCTVDDLCDAEGTCSGKHKNCADDKDCTVDSCSDNGLCQHDTAACKCLVATDCDDGNPCTTDACNGANQCTHEPKQNQACDDENPCTTGDECDGALCVGQKLDCDDKNACTLDSCSNGTCQHPVQEGMDCDDQLACTKEDSCQANGTCAGTQLDCNDQKTCTTDQCDESSGMCENKLIIGSSCNDGSACTTVDKCQPNGECLGSSISCNDNNLCTDDSCDPASGCTHSNNTAACDDKGACTMSDECAGGKCVGALIAGCHIGSDDITEHGGAAAYSKAQAFVAPAAQITKVEIHALDTGNAPWEVRILSALPAADDTGEVKASDRDAKTLGVASVISSVPGWVTFTFLSPVAVKTGTTYYLFVENAVPAFGNGPVFNWSSSAESATDAPYVGGYAYFLAQGQWIEMIDTAAKHRDNAFRIWP